MWQFWDLFSSRRKSHTGLIYTWYRIFTWIYYLSEIWLAFTFTPNKSSHYINYAGLADSSTNLVRPRPSNFQITFKSLFARENFLANASTYSFLSCLLEIAVRGFQLVEWIFSVSMCSCCIRIAFTSGLHNASFLFFLMYTTYPDAD